MPFGALKPECGQKKNGNYHQVGKKTMPFGALKRTRVDPGCHDPRHL